MPVFDLKGRRIGRVKDAAIVPLVHPSRIDRFLVGGGDAWLTVRYDQVRSISLATASSSATKSSSPITPTSTCCASRRDLLDQQIIDVTAAKWSASTTSPCRIAARWRARHAQRARSGYRRPQHLPPRCSRASLPPQLDPPPAACRFRPTPSRWEFCNIVEPDPQRRLRLNISYTKLEEMHPADLADIVEELGPADAKPSSKPSTAKWPPRRCPKSKPENAGQHSGIARTREGRRHRRGDVARRGRRHALRAGGGDQRRDSGRDGSAPKTEVRELLEFDEDTAGGMMNTEYVVAATRTPPWPTP